MLHKLKYFFNAKLLVVVVLYDNVGVMRSVVIAIVINSITENIPTLKYYKQNMTATMPESHII